MASLVKIDAMPLQGKLMCICNKVGCCACIALDTPKRGQHCPHFEE